MKSVWSRGSHNKQSDVQIGGATITEREGEQRERETQTERERERVGGL